MSTLPQPRIFLSPPHMGGNELRYVEDAFASNYIAPMGPMVDRFEQKFSEISGIPYCVALTSGTAAIHLALRGLGIGPGDMVFCSDLTFIGSIAPVLYLGATPIFIDADAQSWNMDAALLAEALAQAHKANQLPKAVLVTDLYGQCADYDAIHALCERYGIAMVTDAAESVGAHYKGQHAGNVGAAAAFSFNGNKIITSSGGGMLASHNKQLIDEARFLSQQARDPAPHYEHTTYGYNYRMSNIVAAVGCGQLDVLAERVARRRAVFARYREKLAHLAGVSFMEESADGIANRWLSVIVVDAERFGCDRERIRLALEAENIESRPVWKPMHLQPVFKDYRIIGGTVGARYFRDGLCLPSGTAMTDADIDRICSIIIGLHA